MCELRPSYNDFIGARENVSVYLLSSMFQRCVWCFGAASPSPAFQPAVIMNMFARAWNDKILVGLL